MNPTADRGDECNKRSDGHQAFREPVTETTSSEGMAHSALPANLLLHSMQLVIAGAVSLVILLLVARRLGPVETGYYTYVLWWLEVGILIVGFGWPTTISKFVAESLAQRDRAGALAVVRWALRVELWLASLSMGLLALVVYRGFVPPLRRLMLIGVLDLLPGSLARFFHGACQGLQEFVGPLKVITVCSLLRLVLTVIVVAMGTGVPGVLVAWVVTHALIAVGLGILARHHLGGQWALRAPIVSRPVRQRLWRYTLNLGAILMLDAIVLRRSEVFFLERGSPPTEIAYYSLAHEMALLLSVVPSLTAVVLLPVIADHYAHQRWQEIASMYTTALRGVALVVLPVSVWCAFCARPLVTVILGTQYLSAVWPLRLLALAMGLSALGMIGGGIMCGMTVTGRFVALSVVIAAVNLFLAWMLVPSYGAVGAAAAKAITLCLGAVGITMMLQRRLVTRLPVQLLLRILAISVVLGGLAYGGLRLWGLSGLVVMSVLILMGYGRILRRSGVVRSREVAGILKGFSFLSSRWQRVLLYVVVGAR